MYELFLSCNCKLVSVTECDEIEQANGRYFDGLEVCTRVELPWGKCGCAPHCKENMNCPSKLGN